MDVSESSTTYQLAAIPPVVPDISPEQAIAQEIDSIWIERGVLAKAHICACYWEIGSAIRQYSPEGESPISRILPFIESNIEKSSLYRATQFHDQNPDFADSSDLVGAIINRFGKHVTWRRLIEDHLPKDSEEKPKKKSAKELREETISALRAFSMDSIGSLWGEDQHTAINSYLDSIQ